MPDRSPCCGATLDEAHHDGMRYLLCGECIQVVYERREWPTVEEMRRRAEEWRPVEARR